MNFLTRAILVAAWTGVVSTSNAIGQEKMVHAAATEAKVLSLGFEVLPDGSSRLSLVLSAPVAVEETSSSRLRSYRIKPAKMVRKTDALPLVTEHFETVLLEAHLEVIAGGVDLVLSLREECPVTWNRIEQDGGVMLQIDLPKVVK